MQFKQGAPLFSYRVEREGGEDILYINYLGASFVPSLAESYEVMGRTVDSLIENPNVSRIVLVQQKNYNYDSEETFMLHEIARFYVYLVKQEAILTHGKLVTSPNAEGFFNERYNEVFSFLYLLKQDPLAAYFELKKILIKAKILLEKLEPRLKTDQAAYIGMMEKAFSLLEKTRLVQKAMPYLETYKKGDRNIYYGIFKPDVIPNFTFTRLVMDLPEDAEVVDQYKIASNTYDESLVTVLRKKDEAKLIYHLSPPENSLSEDYTSLLNLARGVLIEHQPKAEEFTDTDRTRQVFFNISKDLLQDLARTQGIKLDYNDLSMLSTILVRHTIGFGLIEILLQDKKIQDIVLNAPIPMTKIFLRHQEFDECSTNILPSQEDVDSWAAKFRLISGRPLDEANPILDTQLGIGNLRARIAIIQQPLSPDGLAYAIRRHREEPWTLPLFVKNKMINSFTAGLLSFLIDGSRTLLVAGTRSSGKCVDGNTLIQLDNGEISKIKDLIGKKKKEISDGTIYEPNAEIYAKSLKKIHISDSKITDVWKRSSPDKVIKIRTKSGKEIITTKEHPYFTYDGGMKNTSAGYLKKGDLIASPRNLEIAGNEININLKKHEAFLRESEDFFVLKGKTNSSVVKFPKKITSELAEFIGMVLGDGYLDDKKLEFYNNCKELRERYIILLSMFGVRYRVFRSRTTTVVQTTSRILSRILNEVFEIPFGKKSDKIVIPQNILKSSNFVLARFLRGYFDCDGDVPKGKRDLELLSASKGMSEYLRLALLRFGITSFVKTKKIDGVDYYRILIKGSFVDDFAKKIGFLHPLKKERLDKLFLKNFLENTNIDTIPSGNSLLRELRKKLRVSPKELKDFGKDCWAYENDKYGVTRKWFKKLVGFYRCKYNKIYSLKNQVDYIRKLAKFDLKSYLGKVEALRRFIGASYASLAFYVGMSEGGLRKSLQLQRISDLNSLAKISKCVEFLESKNTIPQSRSLINELSHETIAVNSVLAGVILSNLRNSLSISNEDLSERISIGSVSNFFNGVYVPSFRILQCIIKEFVDIYDSVISEDANILISEAEKLANSDIFWDEVVYVEEIDKIDDFVYDLTVENTHNFVANGIIAHNTSLLGSLMLEIIPRYRIIVIEDSLELPVESLRKLNYDILRMKVRSALLKTTNEVGADDGIRTSLRLGDSSLIIGEVRSVEAKALYEAMRIGALANVVAGTIHGASPYAVFDRVVNDLGVPATSFKATDIIAVANPIKSPDGLHSMRRLIQLSEVRKRWNKDPLEEKGFVDLIKYNVEKDELEPTEDLINGDSEIIKDIASNVRGWAGNWDAVYDNILLRAKVKEEIVKVAKKTGNEKILEAKFNSLSNHKFHVISDKIRQEVGLPESDRVFPKWQEWLNKEIKKKKI